MRHQRKVKKFGRMTDSRKALLRGLATNLVIYEKIKTTVAKAKALRSTIERLITKAKKNDLTARRELIKVLYTVGAVNKLLTVITPKYKDRKGGYTRVTKIGQRKGDAAQAAYIEFV
jgi:large subunit ribosomal protein L17